MQMLKVFIGSEKHIFVYSIVQITCLTKEKYTQKYSSMLFKYA